MRIYQRDIFLFASTWFSSSAKIKKQNRRKERERERGEEWELKKYRSTCHLPHTTHIVPYSLHCHFCGVW